jgi:Ser/Thr protein kinase RdoA (MazF antagonist)
MTNIFPTAHTIFSGEALVTHILPRYGLGAGTQCSYHSFGFNDTYEVKTPGGERLFLRVYRRSWRSVENARYEVEALNHLHGRGFPAAHPIPDQNGSFLQVIHAPEGERAVVLFTLAPGREPTYEEQGEQKAFAYGQAVARMHALSSDFSSPWRRQALDLDYLLDTPFATIQPLLAHRPDDLEYMLSFSFRLRQAIEALPTSELDTGFIHADVQGFHHHVAEDGTLTFFDFDCCGPGYRAYDMGIFRWCFYDEANRDGMWAAYLRGYQDIRTMNEADLRAAPLMVGARYLWHMGIHTVNAPNWGFGGLNDAYWDRALKRLRTFEAEGLLPE